ATVTPRPREYRHAFGTRSASRCHSRARIWSVGALRSVPAAARCAPADLVSDGPPVMIAAGTATAAASVRTVRIAATRAPSAVAGRTRAGRRRPDSDTPPHLPPRQTAAASATG